MPATPSTAPPAVEWRDVLARWVQSIDDEVGLGGDRTRMCEHAADVVETLFERRTGAAGALTRFGRRLGGDGWPLDQVSRWVDALGVICPAPASDRLRTFESGIALAQGWAEGSMHGMRADECFDGITGLCTPTVLRMRMLQVFEHCAAMSVEPNWMYRVLVVDADLSRLPALDADAVMVILADIVQRRFSSGETLARVGSRIVGLVRDSPSLEANVVGLMGESEVSALLATSRVLAWAEDLPDGIVQLDRYLADLVA